MEKWQIKEKKITIVISLFFFVDIVSQFMNRGKWVFIVQMLISCYALYLNRDIKLNKYDKKYIIYILIMMIFALLSSIYNKNTSFNSVVATIMYGIIGLILIKRELSIKIINIFFTLVAILCLYVLIQGGGEVIIEIISTSRNSISVYLLIQVGLVYIAYEKKNKEIPIWQTIVATLLSIWATGRSGAITMLILLFLLICYKLYHIGFSIKKTLSTFIILFLVVIISYLNFEILFSSIIDRFQDKGLTDYAREWVITEYINKSLEDPLNLSLGVKMVGNHIFEDFHYNLHNSYLRLHAYYGLAGFSLVLYCIIKRFLYYMREKKYIYIILLIAIFIRISTDTIAFYGIFDSIIYYLLFNYENQFILNERTLNAK